MLGLLAFQIPEARTQAIFTDSQLHIWAVEGRQEMLFVEIEASWDVSSAITVKS